MSELLHKCITKATIAEGDQLKFGPNWIAARRAMLKVFDDHLECGDWRIDYEDIITATLYSVRAQFFLPAFVLRVETGSTTYHFGLNAGSFWKGDLPFPVQREKARMRYSPFSIAVRVIFLSGIVYFVWTLLNR